MAQIAITLDATDLTGAPLPNNQIAVGNDFLLRASVQDVRPEPTGVFAAFLDVAYDNPDSFSVVFSETQRLTFSNKTTGGSYRLAFGSETTGDIVFGPSVSETILNLRAALEALSGIGAGNVEIVQNRFIDDQNPSENNPFRFELKFVNALFETDVPNLTVEAIGLTVSEGSPSLVVDEIAKGVRSDAEAFRRAFQPSEDYPFGLTAVDGDRDPDDNMLLDPNVFSEVGSFDGSGFFGREGDKRSLWSVRLNADAEGEITFTGSPADEPVRSDVLVFGTEDPVPLSEVSFNSVTVSIVGSGSGGVDFGDAPNSYQTLLPAGASHALGSGLLLGSLVDPEADGQPGNNATGDDGDGTNDDDGVLQIAAAIATTAAATTSSFLVTASADAKLDAWIDFNGNGLFDHPDEHLGQGTSIDVVAGDNIVSYTVPAGSTPGDTFTRFRISSTGGLQPGGAAADGEVEDYRHSILDGDLGATAHVDLIAGHVEVSADGSEITVTKDSIELFRGGGGAVSALEFHGTGGDNNVGLANLTSAIPNSIPISFSASDGYDKLRLTGSGQTLDLTDAGNAISNVEEIDIIGASPNQLILDAPSVIETTDASNSLLVKHDADDTVSYGSGWNVEAPVFVAGEQRHILSNGNARVETINTLPWQNPLAATDVNFNEETTSLDALLIINFIGRSAVATVPLAAPTAEAELPEHYVDVNGSQTATALDALLVINFLGQQSNESEAENVSPAAPRIDLDRRLPVDRIDRDFDTLAETIDALKNFSGITSRPFRGVVVDPIPISAASDWKQLQERVGDDPLTPYVNNENIASGLFTLVVKARGH